MNPLEKEERLAFEALTTRNVKAAVAHSNDTRALVRDLQEQVKRLINTLLSREEDLKQIKIQLAALQQKIYRGGTE